MLCYKKVYKVQDQDKETIFMVTLLMNVFQEQQGYGCNSYSKQFRWCFFSDFVKLVMCLANLLPAKLCGCRL